MKLTKPHIILPIILLAASLLLHFIFIGQPSEVVFDEVHYGKYINGYLTGEFFYNIHPPLGTLLLGAGSWLGGYQEAMHSFENIGQTLENSASIALRLLPAFAGSLLGVVLFFFARSLGLSLLPSFFVGLFILLDNALLVHSRFALPDVFLLLFGFLGLAFFFRRQLLLASIFFGLAISIKWTGLAFLGVAGLILLFDIITRKVHYTKLLWFIIVPPLLYVATFALHFSFLSNAGPGDVFMSQEFLEGKKNFAEKTIELNKLYYTTNRDHAFEHPYASKWYAWPVMTRPIFYWAGDNARIYLLGNPIVWWGSTLSAVLFFLFFLFRNYWKDRIALILVLGYIASFLPFVLIDRVLFLYHYFTPLIFSIVMLSYIISKEKHANKIYAVLFILAFIAFIYFAPLTYGLKQSPEQYENRVWFSTWR